MPAVVPSLHVCMSHFAFTLMAFTPDVFDYCLSYCSGSVSHSQLTCSATGIDICQLGWQNWQFFHRGSQPTD